MSSEIRFGLVGTGHWAESIHLPGLCNCEGVRLIALHGRDLARARSLASRFNLRSIDNYDDFLRQVDAVSFAVPPDIQAKLALRAALQGKHLLLEKPMATTLPEADQLLPAIRQHKVSSAIFLTRLYSPPTLQMIAEARAHSVTRLEGSFVSRALLPGSPYANSGWRLDPYGALLDMGPHLLSVAIAILGPVQSIRARQIRLAAFDIRTRHVEGGDASMCIDLRGASGDSDTESWQGAGPDRSFRVGSFTHDSQQALRSAAHSLLNGHHFSPAPDAKFGRDLVSLLDAARASVASGGREQTPQP